MDVANAVNMDVANAVDVDVDVDAADLNGEQDYYTHTASGGYDFYNGTAINYEANGI